MDPFWRRWKFGPCALGTTKPNGEVRVCANPTRYNAVIMGIGNGNGVGGELDGDDLYCLLMVCVL